MVLKGTTKWEYFCHFVESLHNKLIKKHAPEKLVYIMDNAPIHRAHNLNYVLL